jgi:hypothetical protein
MKFSPHIKATRRAITPRRLAAARRALQAQAEAVAMVQRWRDHEAASWKRARRMFRALPPAQRAEVEARYWGNRFMPKTAVYLLETIHAVTKEAQP